MTEAKWLQRMLFLETVAGEQAGACPVGLSLLLLELLLSHLPMCTAARL